MIWKFDNSNTYLLGSVHVLKPGIEYYSKDIDHLYSISDHIVFETDLDNPPIHLMKYGNGERLGGNISNNLYTKTKKRWEKYGLSLADLDLSKPWAAATVLSIKLLEKHGMEWGNGIDKELFIRTKNDNKVIHTLESQDTAYSCLDNAPPEEQQEFLSMVISNPDGILTMYSRILNSWASNNTASLIAILQDCLKTLPLLYTGLVIERNGLWTNAILDRIKSGQNNFIVVGALHCVDTCSIQNNIRNIHGYTSSNIYETC